MTPDDQLNCPCSSLVSLPKKHFDHLVLHKDQRYIQRCMLNVCPRLEVTKCMTTFISHSSRPPEPSPQREGITDRTTSWLTMCKLCSSRARACPFFSMRRHCRCPCEQCTAHSKGSNTRLGISPERSQVIPHTPIALEVEEEGPIILLQASVWRLRSQTICSSDKLTRLHECWTQFNERQSNMCPDAHTSCRCAPCCSSSLRHTKKQICIPL